MSDIQVAAEATTTCAVDADGGRVRIAVRCDGGGSASLVLPLGCVTQLLMTLPQLIQRALQRSHGDASLRLVHPLSGYTLERGLRDGDGQQYILTLQTEGGFGVSFAAREGSLSMLAHGLTADVAVELPGEAPGLRYS